MYRVKDIIEPDFGCEGLPEGEEPCCEVLLEDGNGKEVCVKVPDAELYRKRITAGCEVLLDDNTLERADHAAWRRLYEAVGAVQNGRRVSEYVEAGGVAAAIEAGSGKIYTGVCVDTACTLGICAERNAIFQMLTNGESKIVRVLALMPDGKTAAPCGACRELMVQLMPEDYRNIEIMADYDSMTTVTLGELTPDWWI